LLLAYYDPDGRLVYAGRAVTGIDNAELERLWRSLQPLAIPRMPLDVPPPRDSRFGSRLVLNRVHRVRPELVAEFKYLPGPTRTSRRESPAARCRTRNPLNRRAPPRDQNAVRPG
jgi:ATP-dependent DNA ligase